MPIIKFPLLHSDGNQSHRVVRLQAHRLFYFNNLGLGVPHCATKDDVYEGYRIPKGSIVIFNAWYVRRICKMLQF